MKGIDLRGNFLCVGDGANKARLWRLSGGDPSRLWMGHRAEGGGRVEVPLPPSDGEVTHLGSVYCARVTAQGVVASVGWNRSDLRLWQLGSPPQPLQTSAPVLCAMAIAADWKQPGAEVVLVGQRNGRVEAWSMASGAFRYGFVCNSALKEVSCLAVSGTTLVTACEYGPQAIRVWQLAAAQPPTLVTTHDPGHVVAALALCPAARRLASTATDGTLHVWAPAEYDLH